MLDIFEWVLFIAEHIGILVAVNVGMLLIVRKECRILTVCLLPATLLTMAIGVTIRSHAGDDYGVHRYDSSLPSVRVALEGYIADGTGDLESILESGLYQPKFGSEEFSYLMKDLFRHTLFHSNVHNADNIDEGYNKGNDWFEATLGEPMVYTSGIYHEGHESLVEAQNYKLDYVAKALGLKEGDNVLDIGCGWGRLAKHFAEKYGANVTGITLSSDQLAYGRKLTAKTPNVHLMLQDAMTMHERSDFKKFTHITSLEMAEHVGIKRYGQFLREVRGLLEDGGVLYFQVAGLRRYWQWEDLVWGLFMGEHVFPGADASCPLGWVSTQLERNGFEVQRVQNLGSHYSRTLDQWLGEWRKKKAELSAKYGAVAWRRWEVFLRWSVRIARQGSSTVFMITATKAGDEPARIAAQRRLAP
jgi:cyclopropane fatty-acyl-phospholipid synthase-like methyltransferase